MEKPYFLLFCIVFLIFSLLFLTDSFDPDFFVSFCCVYHVFPWVSLCLVGSLPAGLCVVADDLGGLAVRERGGATVHQLAKAAQDSRHLAKPSKTFGKTFGKTQQNLAKTQQNLAKIRKIKNISIKTYFGDIFLLFFVVCSVFLLEFEGFLKVRESF